MSKATQHECPIEVKDLSLHIRSHSSHNKYISWNEQVEMGWIHNKYLANGCKSCSVYHVVITLRQVLPCHRHPERCQSALHSAPPGGACWSEYRCGSFGAVARRQYPEADPTPWESPAGTPAPALSPPADKDAAAAAKWEPCSWSACSYQGCPTPSSSQDWLRAWDDEEMMDRRHKQAKWERSLISRCTRGENRKLLEKKSRGRR